MKFIRILPDTWASTLWPLSSSTRNMALGSGSTTVPSTSIASSLAIASGRPCEHVRPVLSDGDGVLEVRGEAPVRRHRRPAVLQHLHLPGAHSDHRLDGQHHAGLQGRTPPGVAEVRHLRLLVKGPADAVAHEGAHHPEAVTLAMHLHGVRDVADAVAHPALDDGLVEALPRHVDELLHPGRHRAHGKGHRAVTVVALDYAAEVEPDDVALLQPALGRRNAVHHLLVDGGAHGGGIAPIPLEGRGGALGHDERLHLDVDVLGGDARLHQPHEERLHPGEDLPGRAHVLDLAGRFEEDHRVAAWRVAERMASATCATEPSPAIVARRLRLR